MKSVFKALDIKATDDEVNSVIHQMDTDGDGEISFEEFVRVMGAQFYRKYTDQEVKAAFRHFDKNGDGYISTEVYHFLYLC